MQRTNGIEIEPCLPASPPVGALASVPVHHEAQREGSSTVERRVRAFDKTVYSWRYLIPALLAVGGDHAASSAPARGRGERERIVYSLACAFMCPLPVGPPRIIGKDPGVAGARVGLQFGDQRRAAVRTESPGERAGPTPDVTMQNF